MLAIIGLAALSANGHNVSGGGGSTPAVQTALIMYGNGRIAYKRRHGRQASGQVSRFASAPHRLEIAPATPPRKPSKDIVAESLYVKVVFRAAHAKGGIEALAEALDVSVSEVQVWMHGAVPLPQVYFMQLLDIIAEETLRKLAEHNPAQEGARKAGP